MGEGVTRVVATDRKGTRVRTLSEEIARMRIRLTAVLTELDRRRHNATDVKHLAREHAGAVAAGALVLAAIVATPVPQGATPATASVGASGRHTHRQSASPGAGARARCARSRSPCRAAAATYARDPAEDAGRTLLTTAQILAETMRERRRRHEAAPRRDGMHPGRATGVASAPAPDGSRLPPWSSP